MEPGKKAVFLDRDDTLIHNVPYLADPSKVDPIPGASEALQRLRDAGYLLFLFTNQSGIGRGYYQRADAEACNRETEKRLGLSPGFEGICIAPESPDDPEPVYRKPSPRYLEEMISLHGLDPEQVWMVGDKESDVEAGRRAGVNSARIGKSRDAEGDGVPTFASVLHFTDWLLALSGETTED
ncbi:D-glycero-alpha-D-manno-heptose-1,7-bisphosphate 7-phosphatase [Puniceicoccus vermicola]|uniref:D,D-heptose 1,7-bisphosphate phosphatase n=1 Tax=Puniceicoccus vermicola TaxID=388746 RepID=A0A7X1B1L7_9BACT|nr:HAD-IIIA family hydrolase [Puniceicoccus vermicola]MBC2603897.1 HAD-IIIA family hydrolase [Puniceicoccus vermicola]